MKLKISVINEMKQYKILLKPEVFDQENFIKYSELTLNILTKFAQLSSIFNDTNNSYQNSANIRQFSKSF